MMLLSIHMMTSQGRMCVQCVRNSLEGNRTWMNTEKDTLEESCIHVLSVRNVLSLRVTWGNIWMFTEVNTSECGKCFKQNADLTEHSRIHSEEKPFECSDCNKRFTQAGHLVRHSRIHSGEKSYKCHVCKKAFNRSGSLHSHMRVHTGDKPYKCSQCNKSFSHSSTLQRHKRHIYTAIEDDASCSYSHWCKAILM